MRSESKRKLVLDFLQDLRDKDELSVPIHRLNLNEWYSLFLEKTKGISNDSIFNDKQYFGLQMNNIACTGLFESVKRQVVTEPEYTVYFEVSTVVDSDDDDGDSFITESSNEPANDTDNNGSEKHYYDLIMYYSNLLHYYFSSY